MRIDQLLVSRGLASTRSQAQRLIASGVRWKNEGDWKRVAKNGDEVSSDAEVELLDNAEARFVSRGGLKLEGALQHIGLAVTDAVCLDLGQSTGGFTDCLLQRGAAHVVGIDVGFGQLHEQLRTDTRVTCLERVNARGVSVADISAAMASVEAPDEAVTPEVGFDLLVGDLAFISQTLVLPAVVPMLKPTAAVLMLVKPQFELQPGQVGKGGIVTDAALYGFVEQRVRTAHEALGLTVKAYFESSIQGGDGNREFFIYSVR
jgi:23S rRNA (cytidine1920-2'-O)/16S rRNA (cytidine1409-2'-O)-methyltransferase